MMVYGLRLCLFLSLLLCHTLIVMSRLAHAEGESGDVSTLEHQVHALINEHRNSMGLPSLRYSEEIADVARRHSRDMARGTVGLGHEGAEERGRMLLRTISYTQIAENVAGNSLSASSTAQAAVAGWLNSPGHRANLEGNFNLTGIGIARTGHSFFFTQIFLSTHTSARPPVTTQRSYDREPLRPDPEDEDPPPSRSRRIVPPRYEPEEVDPRTRTGRKRVRGGYVQELE